MNINKELLLEIKKSIIKNKGEEEYNIFEKNYKYFLNKDRYYFHESLFFEDINFIKNFEETFKGKYDDDVIKSAKQKIINKLLSNSTLPNILIYDDLPIYNKDNDKDKLNMIDLKKYFKIPVINTENEYYIDYGINKNGIIFSYKTMSCLTPSKNNGYLSIQLVHNGKSIGTDIHRLVAITFLKSTYVKGKVVNHKDNNGYNNLFTNLEWITQKENIIHHGKKTSHESKVIRTDIETGEEKIYESITKAALDVGIHRKNIQLCVNTPLNKRFTTNKGKYTWRFDDITKISSPNVDLTNAKQFPDNPNYYIFNDGRIYNILNKKFLSPWGDSNRNVSLKVTIPVNNKYSNFTIHSLVAKLFIPNDDPLKTEIYHKDRNINNNNVNNLEWLTKSEKMKKIISNK